MTWQTHAIIGANSIWVASLVSPVDEAFPLLIFAGAASALLPDIDATSAKIHYIGKGIFSLFRGVFKHRHFFHSILAMAIVGVLSWIFLRQYHPSLPIVVTLGYASHPFIDGFNFAKTRYLFPKKKKYNLLPKSLRSPVKGWMDQTLFFFGSLGLIIFMLLHYSILV